MFAILGMVRLRLLPATPGNLPQVESADLGITPGPGYGDAIDGARAGLPAGARLLLGLCGADRRRGDQQRRAGVPQAEEQERRDHAAAARHDRDHDVLSVIAGQPMGLKYVDRRPGGPADARRQPVPADYNQDPVIGQIAAGGLRRLLARLLHRASADRRDPGAGREHRVQRLPGARLDPGPGRLPAAPADTRGDRLAFSNGICPGRFGDRADPRVRRPGRPG